MQPLADLLQSFRLQVIEALPADRLVPDKRRPAQRLEVLSDRRTTRLELRCQVAGCPGTVC